MAERPIPNNLFPELPRLQKEEDVVAWARELVDYLQTIFVGRISVIDGRAIKDASIPPGKLQP